MRKLVEQQTVLHVLFLCGFSVCRSLVSSSRLQFSTGQADHTDLKENQALLGDTTVL